MLTSRSRRFVILFAGFVFAGLVTSGIHRLGSAKAQDSKESKIKIDITVPDQQTALNVNVHREKKGAPLEEAKSIQPSSHQVLYLRSWSLILLDNKLKGLSDPNGIKSMKIVITQNGKNRLERNLEKKEIADYVMFHSLANDKSSSRISIKIPPLHAQKDKKVAGDKAVGRKDINRSNHIFSVSMILQQADAMGSGTGSGTVTITITTTSTPGTTITSTVPVEIIDYTPCP